MEELNFYTTYIRDGITKKKLVYRLRTDSERDIPKYRSEEPSFFYAGDKVKVSVTSVVDPNDFYVVREDYAEIVEEISKYLNRVGLQSYHPVWNQTSVACARNSVDKWARVQILKIVTDELLSDKIDVTVKFIDSGDEAVTTPEDLRAAPEWILAHPQYASRCSLIIRPADDDQEAKQADESSWAPLIKQTLALLGKYRTAKCDTEVTEPHGLELTCLETGEDRSIVDIRLMSRYASWTRCLVESGLAKWADQVQFEGDVPTWSNTK